MKLHEKVKLQDEIIVEYRVALTELRRYLDSSKFSIDINVNKNDILMRLCELENNITCKEIQLN